MKHLLTQILLQDLRGEQGNVPECYCRVYTTGRWATRLPMRRPQSLQLQQHMASVTSEMRLFSQQQSITGL